MGVDNRDPGMVRPPDIGLQLPHFDQRTDATFLHRSEIVEHLGGQAIAESLSLIAPPDKKWKPTELSGVDFASKNWQEQVRELQRQSADVPDEIIVDLFFHATTEGALPNYLARLQMFSAMKDHTGTDQTPWALWDRRWTRDEKDHELFLRDMLRFGGRVDMASFDLATGSLIGNGFNMDVEDPYEFNDYVVWQELAAQIAHDNTADHMLAHGAIVIGKGLKKIQGGEGRHAEGYMRVGDVIFRADPNGAILALYNVIKKNPNMPTRLVDDGTNEEGLPNSFDRYSMVANATGIFTATDRFAIFDTMIDRYDISHLSVTGEAAEAQENLLVLRDRQRKTADLLEERRQQGRAAQPDLSSFTWLKRREPTTSTVIFGR